MNEVLPIEFYDATEYIEFPQRMIPRKQALAMEKPEPTQEPGSIEDIISQIKGKL